MGITPSERETPILTPPRAHSFLLISHLVRVYGISADCICIGTELLWNYLESSLIPSVVRPNVMANQQTYSTSQSVPHRYPHKREMPSSSSNGTSKRKTAGARFGTLLSECYALRCTVQTLDSTTLGVANWDSGTIDGIYDTSTYSSTCVK